MNNSMEVKLAKLEQKVDDIGDDLKLNHEEHIELKSSQKEILNKLEKLPSIIATERRIELNTKANKWVETATWFLITTIVISAISFFIWLVQKGIV